MEASFALFWAKIDSEGLTSKKPTLEEILLA
jgi:hypothetical protein